MEFVGFLAAVASLGKVAKSTYNMAELICLAARDAGRLSEQIKNATIPFQTSASALEGAVVSLELHWMDAEKNSPVMKYFNKTSFAANLDQQSLNIITRIESLLDKIDSIGFTESLPFGLSSFFNSVKWIRMRPEIEALHAPIESIKTTLALTINVFILARLSQGKTTPEKDREM